MFPLTGTAAQHVAVTSHQAGTASVPCSCWHTHLHVWRLVSVRWSSAGKQCSEHSHLELGHFPKGQRAGSSTCHMQLQPLLVRQGVPPRPHLAQLHACPTDSLWSEFPMFMAVSTYISVPMGSGSRTPGPSPSKQCHFPVLLLRGLGGRRAGWRAEGCQPKSLQPDRVPLSTPQVCM